MLAVLSELIDGTEIGVRFDFVPGEWVIVSKNIYYRKQALAWEMPNPFVPKVLPVVSNVSG